MSRVTWGEQRRCSQKDNAWETLKVPKKLLEERAPWGPHSPAAKKAREKRPKEVADMPSAAATTRGQLCALGEDERAPECIASYKQSPGSQALKGEETDNPTTEAALDKDAAEREMTDWGT